MNVNVNLTVGTGSGTGYTKHIKPVFLELSIFFLIRFYNHPICAALMTKPINVYHLVHGPRNSMADIQQCRALFFHIKLNDHIIIKK